MAVAALIVFYQLRALRLQIRVDTLLRLGQLFESSSMRYSRRQAAKALIEKERAATLTDVLLFFETVGLLERRRALDREMVWSVFSYPAFRYAEAAKQIINDDRADDETLWIDFVRLVDRLKETEAKERHRRIEDVRVATDDLQEFLEEEAQLPIVGIPT
jgi:hypothetical protein